MPSVHHAGTTTRDSALADCSVLGRPIRQFAKPEGTGPTLDSYEAVLRISVTENPNHCAGSRQSW